MKDKEMNVNQLIERLQAIPEKDREETYVITSSDPEGNTFRLLDDVSFDALASGLSDSSHDMMVLLEEDYDDLPEEDVESLHKAIVLWPV